MAIEVLEVTRGNWASKTRKQMPISMSLNVRHDRTKVSLVFNIPGWAAEHIGIKVGEPCSGDVWIDRETNRIGFLVRKEGGLKFSSRKSPNSCTRLSKTLDDTLMKFVQERQWHPSGFIGVERNPAYEFISSEGQTDFTVIGKKKKK